MDRLVRLVEDSSPQLGYPKITYQIGYSQVIPVHGSWYRWKAPKEFIQDIRDADLVVTHDGASAIGQALEAGKPTIVVPRNQSELDYPVTTELAAELASTRCVLVATTQDDLLKSIQAIDQIRPLVITTREKVDDWLEQEYSDALAHSRTVGTRESS